jgi:hypothetical protein|nr:MAG TPA: hypothetical protein [Caudoviricetes sp.]
MKKDLVTNRWIDLILDTKNKNFITKCLIKRSIRKELSQITPSIEYMTIMAKALTHLSAYFLYPNNKDRSKIASLTYKDTIYIYLNPSEEVNVEIKIVYDQITLTVFNQNKKFMGVTWKEGSAQNIVQNRYEEELFIRVIDNLTTSFGDLIISYI